MVEKEDFEIDQRHAGEVLRSLPGRVLWLLWKLISMQGFILILATGLVYVGKLESYAWIVICALVLFGRASLDIIGLLKK